MSDDVHIGARIATERKLRGLSQQQLAQRAFVSHSLITKVEQGRRPASPAMVAAVGRALRVDRSRLTGQPYRFADRRDDAVHDLVPALRRDVLAHRLSPDRDRPVRALDELEGAVAAVAGAGDRVDLMVMGTVLPELLADVRLASHSYGGDADRERVMRLWAHAYAVGRGFALNLGYSDLATMIADRYDEVAAVCGDPLVATLGDTKRAQDLLAAGDFEGAEQILTRARGGLEPAVDREDPATLAVYGYLHLRSALVAARAGNADATGAHLGEAEELAGRVDAGRNDYGLSFGPSNVGIWTVGLAVELADGPRAVARARDLRIDPATPPNRVGHHYIDLARGHLLAGHRHAALDALLTARRISPQQVRHHPMVRETVHTLALEEKRSSETLRGLAAWIGIDE